MRATWTRAAWALSLLALLGCNSRTTSVEHERTVETERTSSYPPNEEPADVKFRKQEYRADHTEKGGVKVRVNPETGVDVDIQPKRDK